jgi:adenylate cyclase
MNGPAKILAVDDEADFETLIRQRFRQQVRAGEFALRFAHHGEEALAALAAEPDVDLLLLDINMPVMDGLTLLSELRGRERCSPLCRRETVSRSPAAQEKLVMKSWARSSAAFLRRQL